MSRPSKLDERVAERIVQATRKGLPRRRAARLAGIHPATLFDWLARGRAGEQPYADFADRIKSAEIEGEESLVDLLREHAVETWQAAAWLLERRFPARYSLKQRVSHEVHMTPEQARAKYRELTGQDWPGAVTQ